MSTSGATESSTLESGYKIRCTARGTLSGPTASNILVNLKRTSGMGKASSFGKTDESMMEAG